MSRPTPPAQHPNSMSGSGAPEHARVQHPKLRTHLVRVGRRLWTRRSPSAARSARAEREKRGARGQHPHQKAARRGGPLWLPVVDAFRTYCLAPIDGQRWLLDNAKRFQAASGEPLALGNQVSEDHRSLSRLRGAPGEVPMERSRGIIVEGRLGRALLALRLLERDALPVRDLNAQLLADVEAVAGHPLPDGVLATFAANVGELRDNAEMELKNVVSFTESARAQGCGENLIAVGRQPDGHAFYCVDPIESGGGTLRLYEFDLLDSSVSSEVFAVWLEARVEARREFLTEGDSLERERSAVTPTKADILEFAPRVVYQDKVGAVRRVHHKSFGTGTVTTELEGGKLEVDFASAGKKVLLARFVKDI